MTCNDFFYADMLCHDVALTFDRLALNVCSTSSVTRPKSVQSLSEIKRSLAELLIN